MLFPGLSTGGPLTATGLHGEIDKALTDCYDALKFILREATS